MLSMLLEQLAERSLISGDAAISSRALLEAYERQGDILDVGLELRADDVAGWSL
jgi:hypothetical protein